MANYEVIIIKEGYCIEKSSSIFLSDCTITLLKGPLNILVDTGNPNDKDFLIKALSQYDLTVDDIHYVIGTHGHVDHVGNLNLFQKAAIIVSHDICRGDRYEEHDFNSGRPYEIDENVDVMSTPGHTSCDVSVLVRNVPGMGTVVVAGDIFEKEEDLEEPSLWMDRSSHVDLHVNSRLKIMSLADYIIPGHGPMFHVKSKYRRHISIEEESSDPPESEKNEQDEDEKS